MATASNSRQLAFLALQEIYQKKAYTDIALDRVLRSSPELSSVEKSLTCELVYGIVRRQRTLDSLINLLGKKKAQQQPPNLRIILQMGLYQLRYLDHIPVSAAVNTSVELAKQNGLKKLAGVVNGLLREYLRQATNCDPLELPNNPVTKIGIKYSFPDWIVETFLQQLPASEVEQLCGWFNQPAQIDLRINLLKTSLETVEKAFLDQGITTVRVPHLSQTLRLTNSAGKINQLPGYEAGWWMVQDSSAQLVTHLLDPQPGETIVDACAAPGGKTTHIAELIKDQGVIYACDLSEKRLNKVQENAQRLQLKSIKICPGDSRNRTVQCNSKFLVDRVLLDAPCSGLGTLHKRPDIRWRQTLTKIGELSQLQQQLLNQAATWVKPGGIIVYATCTLNRLENEVVIESFLQSHPEWQIESSVFDSPANHFATFPGWIKVFPHKHNMDGFFMVKLQREF
ncbi:sun protein [Stanieria cyanosphaera PCC 7437]|uniref:16S rRNA (cytosine(967)-C(5))-methyltransferase n=1 Tax=Stanieria cyanosphaera (strain ATCC 29371 / PCC 7437) TaxID=111780 RepID=K9XST5_STAC7|nr:16S rRNA (cytosine(967)-C(5))-methyltransferase [Stanieria cyanosphaera]AFZ35136.1 sun protein [Stanieria cyanosphaera PCC 7437]